METSRVKVGEISKTPVQGLVGSGHSLGRNESYRHWKMTIKVIREV